MKKNLLFAFAALNVVCGLSQRINEVCPSNTTILELGFQRYPDWIEFYNDTDEPIDLEGYSVSDNSEDLFKWTFESGMIEPGDFYIISAVKNSTEPGVISFSLSKKGETIFLVNPEGFIVDSVQFPRMDTDDSYGRLGEKWYFFDQPTPGDFNYFETAYKGYAELPAFSIPSGYYTPGTTLYLENGINDEYLFYSLNGTNPLDCQPYEEPFTLTKTTTITSIAQGDSLIDSQPVRKTYFVGYGRHELPVVNLGVDSLILFDETTGICVPGPDADDTFPFSGANFWGDEKVNGWFQYFDKYFQLEEELPIELKVHGGSGSRIHPMKSFQLRARDGKFENRYFDEKTTESFERLLLRNAGNDYCNTCMKDGSIHDYLIKNNLNLDLQAYSPVVVYINGNYHGIQNIREKVDRHYLASNYDIDPDNVNILEGGDLRIVEGESSGFEKVIDYVSTNDLSVPAYYNWIKDHLDIESFIDYFIVELYVNNRDWPNNNIKLWNSLDYSKWRYFCYDLDGAFNYVDESDEARESLKHILNNYVASNPHVMLFSALLENDDFKTQFINRYADLMNTVFLPDDMYQAFVKQKGEIEEDMNIHYLKWCGTSFLWNERFAGTYGFVFSRPEIVFNELKSVFNQKEITDIAVDVYPYGSGDVRLNTLTLNDFPFTGKYFDGTPIELEAVSSLGGTFQYWQNARTGERVYDEILQVNPTEGDRFVAVFSSESEQFDLSVVPNPVGSNATIRFSLPEQSEVIVRVFDARGNLVKELTNLEELPMGNQFISWSTAELESGVYTVSVLTASNQESVQLVKL